MFNKGDRIKVVCGNNLPFFDVGDTGTVLDDDPGTGKHLIVRFDPSPTVLRVSEGGEPEACSDWFVCAKHCELA